MTTGNLSTENALLPFALSDRWIVTVESERRLVNVRHRTRWYAVARRKGHEDRRHWCATLRGKLTDPSNCNQSLFQRFGEGVVGDCKTICATAGTSMQIAAI